MGNGKLVYSKPPPGGDIEEYRKTTPVLSEVMVDQVKLRSTMQQIIVQNQKKDQKKREDTLEDDVYIRSFEVGSRLGVPKQNGKKHFNKRETKRAERDALNTRNVDIRNYLKLIIL